MRDEDLNREYAKAVEFDVAKGLEKCNSWDEFYLFCLVRYIRISTDGEHTRFVRNGHKGNGILTYMIDKVFTGNAKRRARYLPKQASAGDDAGTGSTGSSSGGGQQDVKPKDIFDNDIFSGPSR